MRRSLLLPALLLAGSAALTACGGGSDKPAASKTAPSDVTAATTEVKQSWADFFDGSKAAADRVALLEDGASLGQALTLSAKDPSATLTKAQVTSVTFTDPTHADVKYDLLVSGNKVLTGADGKAVLVGGHWQVSKQTFCGLLSLKAGGAAVPGC